MAKWEKKFETPVYMIREHYQHSIIAIYVQLNMYFKAYTIYHTPTGTILVFLNY